MIMTAADEPNKKLKLVSTPLQPPVAVLDDEYYDTIGLIEAYVGKVTDKCRISDALQEMKTLLPMPKVLNHLKRVRGGQVILALPGELSKDACLDIVKNKLKYLEPIVCSCQIPAKQPKTKKQHEEANRYWPCNFHPSKVIEQFLADTFFSAEEVEKLLRYMRTAINVARRNRSVAAAVVVNPKRDVVVAESFDERQKNPSQHAVLMAIEKVAEVHRALFRDRRCAGEDPLARCSSSQETRDSTAVKDGEDDLPYLCTGYDVFVTREPCCMCAMAMVHSRVRRVFYGCESTVGALGTKCKLHVNRRLNHHYLVFKGLLSAECKTLEAEHAGGS